MKKVLLVGDLRSAGNYGATATSQALIDLLQEKIDDNHLATIDFRSFRHETPPDGWPVYSEPSRNKVKECLKILLRKIHLMSKAKAIKKWLPGHEDLYSYHVPIRYKDYKSFSVSVLNGQHLKYEKDKIEWADIVIINSEGNIVNGTDKNGVYRIGGLYVLYIAYLSKVIMKKTTYIINHTVDPKNRDIVEIIKHLYPKLDGVYIREKCSCKMLDTFGITNYRYIPDALFTYNFDIHKKPVNSEILKGIDFTKPYICIGDSSGIKNQYNAVKWDVIKVYTQLIVSLRKICPQIIFVDGFDGGNEEINQIILRNNLPYVNMKNCSFEMLYSVLEGADIFISGRWHASIIALKAHTPILLWGSDSHKTEALYSEIDWPFWFFDCESVPANIDRICLEIQKVLKYDCADIWDKIDELSVAARKNTDML